MVKNGSKKPKEVDFPKGKWVDSLENLDITKNTVAGKWTQKDGSLITKPSNTSRIMLPLTIEGDYDLTTEFTRLNGADGIAIMLPVGDTSCTLVINGWPDQGGGKTYLSHINNIEADDNRNAITGKIIQNGRVYKCDISVRTKNNQAAIRVHLNNRPIIIWKGPENALSAHPSWALKDNKSPGVGAQNSMVDFKSLKIRSVSGEIKKH